MKKLLQSIAFLLLSSCSNHTEENLPVLGERSYNGQDTVYATIRTFKFINQDSNIVTNQTFANKVYVADFIFLSCPSICPMMNKNMLAVYETFKDNPDVLFLSHTIDPERDSIPRLKAYAENLGLSADKWHFVTGNKDSIFSVCENSYFLAAYPDQAAPGGYAHSGGLLLVDKQKRIRGVYDGTNAQETARLINDIRLLLREP